LPIADWFRRPPKAQRRHKYVRPVGSICFEVPARDDALQLVRTLETSDLSWVWTAWPRSPLGDVSQAIFRRIDQETVKQFVVDLETQDEPYSYRFGLLLLGGQELAADLAQANLLAWVRQFSDGQPGALQVAIVDPGDTPASYLFVQPNYSPSVQNLLSRMGALSCEYTSCAYSRLNTIALEEFVQHARF
jgi:hypothetical protein